MARTKGRTGLRPFIFFRQLDGGIFTIQEHLWFSLQLLVLHIRLKNAVLRDLHGISTADPYRLGEPVARFLALLLPH
jgi:hypothetical protein